MSGMKWKKIKVLKYVLGVLLVGMMVCGCGNLEKEQYVEEMAERETEEAVGAGDDKDEIAEFSEGEQQIEQEAVEIYDEEKSMDMPQVEVKTTVADNTEFAQYMAELDPNMPHIVIWNESEGYIIDMGEGEYYQLETDDRIFLNWNTNIEEISYSIPEENYQSTAHAIEIIPDYSQFDKPLECRYKIVLADDPTKERIKLTCYLDAPIE